MEIREGIPEDAKDIVPLIGMGIEEGVFHNRAVSVKGYLEFAFHNRRQ